MSLSTANSKQRKGKIELKYTCKSYIKLSRSRNANLLNITYV